MYKRINSKKNYEHRKQLKYLTDRDIAEEQRLLVFKLDAEVKKINSSPHILPGPKLLKSGKPDRTAQ